jgi:hypothetical protein
MSGGLHSAPLSVFEVRTCHASGWNESRRKGKYPSARATDAVATAKALRIPGKLTLSCISVDYLQQPEPSHAIGRSVSNSLVTWWTTLKAELILAHHLASFYISYSHAGRVGVFYQNRAQLFLPGAAARPSLRPLSKT